MKDRHSLPCLFSLGLSLALASCDKAEVAQVSSIPAQQADDQSAAADRLPTGRGKRIVEDLLSIQIDIRKSIKYALENDRKNVLIPDFERFAEDLSSLRAHFAQLSKEDQMLVKGKFAVASVEMGKELKSILEKDPGNDDLAVAIHLVKTQFSPIFFENLAPSKRK